jgi:predicted RNase H-related nuclease YkuK (DUF458 family)
MKNFKRFGDIEVEDLGAYVRDYIIKNKDVTIFVGTDSEQYRKHTQFATCVMLYHEGKGAHYVFRKFSAEDDKGRKTKIKDLFSRMFAEMMHSYEVAEYLEPILAGYYNKRDGDMKLVTVDVDVNPSSRWKSNVAHAAVTGFLRGERYKCRTKPYAWSASCAADLIVRK